MEEKKINIDVTKCELYLKNFAFGNCRLGLLVKDKGKKHWCDNNPNCYYKQLQLKDKEIKKLNKMIELMAIDGMNSVEYIFKYYKQQALAELEE